MFNALYEMMRNAIRNKNTTKTDENSRGPENDLKYMKIQSCAILWAVELFEVNVLEFDMFFDQRAPWHTVPVADVTLNDSVALSHGEGKDRCSLNTCWALYEIKILLTSTTTKYM